MVDFSYGNDGKVLNEEYHLTRWAAEVTTYNIDEWSDIDQARYDLDTVDFTRQFKRSSYITESRVDSEGASESGFDLRNVKTRD